MKQVISIMFAFIAWLAISFITNTFCLIQSFIGLPCPACGTMRAAWHLLNGEIQTALFYHPLIFVTIIICAVCAIGYVVFKKALKINWEPSGKNFHIMLYFAGALYIAVFIVRLVMFFPHTEPMVPNSHAIWRLAFNFLQGLRSL